MRDSRFILSNVWSALQERLKSYYESKALLEERIFRKKDSTQNEINFQEQLSETKNQNTIQFFAIIIAIILGSLSIVYPSTWKEEERNNELKSLFISLDILAKKSISLKDSLHNSFDVNMDNKKLKNIFKLLKTHKKTFSYYFHKQRNAHQDKIVAFLQNAVANLDRLRTQQGKGTLENKNNFFKDFFKYAFILSQTYNFAKNNRKVKITQKERLYLVLHVKKFSNSNILENIQRLSPKNNSVYIEGQNLIDSIDQINNALANSMMSTDLRYFYYFELYLHLVEFDKLLAKSYKELQNEYNLRRLGVRNGIKYCLINENFSIQQFPNLEKHIQYWAKNSINLENCFK